MSWHRDHPGYSGAAHTDAAIARLPVTLEAAKDMAWEDFPWPEWIPDDIRKSIGHPRRTVYQYLTEYASNNAPAMGTRVHVYPRRGPGFVIARGVRCTLGPVGRWVYAWGNMGRVILDNGEICYPNLGRIEACEGGSLDDQ